jgi:DNA-binding NarL/FixJ family response regulator
MEATTTILRIMLVDDHQLFLDSLKILLSQLAGIEVVGMANNGEQVLEMLKYKPCEVVIMDINMPQVDGIEATQRIMSKYPHLKILVVSMNLELDIIKKAIQAGAVGYIPKNTGKEELQNALFHLMEGEPYFSKEVSMELAREYMPQNKKKQKNDESYVHLTAREKEIIKLFAAEFTPAEISEKLFISSQTVETHRKNLLKKLDLKNTISLVKYAIKHGLDK